MKDPQLAKIVSEDLRDSIINTFLDIESGHAAAPDFKPLTKGLNELTEKQRRNVRQTLLAAVDSGIHDFLFRLQELHDEDSSVGFYEEGENVAEKSDGLHGEPFSDEGWFAKYSQHGYEKEI